MYTQSQKTKPVEGFWFGFVSPIFLMFIGLMISVSIWVAPIIGILFVLLTHYEYTKGSVPLAKGLALGTIIGATLWFISFWQYSQWLLHTS